MLRHDHVTSPGNTWFNYTEHYNLTHKLNINTCLKIYFFQKGLRLEEYFVYKKDNFSDLVVWIWSFLEISVQIRNIYGSPLVVMFEGFTPNQTDPITLDKNKEVSVEAYMSNIVTFFSRSTQEFLDGYELQSNIDINIEGKFKFKDKEEMWRIKTHFEQRENEESSRLFLCSHYKRHFNILTQPKSVPNFTQTGYKLTNIPPPVYDMLLKIYTENADRLQPEYYPSHFTVWNLDEIDIKQVSLSSGQTLFLSEQVEPIVEEWCSCELEPTMGKYFDY